MRLTNPRDSSVTPYSAGVAEIASPCYMSQTLGQAAGYVRHCNECENAFQTTDSPRDEHCSHECYYADRGQSALNQLHSDHRLCSSCYRYVKSTYCPTDDYLKDASDPTAINGVQYTSGPDGEVVLDVTEVEKTTRPAGIRSDDALDEFCFIGEQFETEHTRHLYGESGPWVCECGNVDLQHHNEVLARQDYEAVVDALGRRLVEFYEKGALSHEPDLGVFFEYIERDADLATATGASLYKT